MGQQEVFETQTYYDVSNKIKVKFLIFSLWFSFNNQYFFLNYKSLNLTYPNQTSQNYTLDFYSYGEIMSDTQQIKSKKNKW